MIKGIKFASITVADQQRSLEFYTDKLGFKVATDQPMGEDGRWIELSIPGAPTRIVLFAASGGDEELGGFSNIAFYSDDVKAAFKTLSAKGAEFTQEPQTANWGSSAMFKDPDGHVFLIFIQVARWIIELVGLR